MVKNFLNFKKGEKLTQIYNPNETGVKVFVRISRPLNVAADAPITPPSGCIEVSMVTDVDMQVAVNADEHIKDAEGSMYAKYLSE